MPPSAVRGMVGSSVTSGMPAVAVTNLCKSLHSITNLMQQVTASLTAKQAITSSVLQRAQLLAEHDEEIQDLCVRLSDEILIIRQESTASWIAGNQQAADHLDTAFTTCVTSFTALIPAAIAFLQQLNTTICSSQHKKSNPDLKYLFLVVTVLICGSCECLTDMSEFVVHSFKASSACTALLPVLNNLLAWMLSFIRSSGPTLQGCLLLFSVQEWHHSMYQCMHLAALLIRISTQTHRARPAELCSVLHALPQGFLATLCCLACELVPLAPKAARTPLDSSHEKCITRYTFIMFTLLQVLNDYMIAHQQVGDAVPRNPDLICQASIEAVKRAVAFFITTPGSREDYMRAAQGTLIRLLSEPFFEDPQDSGPHQDAFSPQTSPRGGGPVSNYSSSTSSASPSYRADLIPRHLTSDPDMLLLLLQSAQRRPQYLLTKTTCLICAIMRSWEVHDSTPAVVCLAYILRHCSHHMRRVMQQQRKPSEQWRTQASSPPLLQTEHSQLQAMMLMTFDGFVETLHICADSAFAESVATKQQRQQQQQEQQRMSSPEWKAIIGWQKLPGSSAVLEMVLREQDHQPECPMHNLTIRAALTNMLVQLKDRLTPCSIRSHISLVVSVHKVLRRQLSSSRQEAPDLDGSVYEPLCYTDIFEPLTYLSATLSAVLAACPAHKLSSSDANVASEPNLGSDSVIKAGMQQLRAVVVVVLVWLANLLMRIMQRENKALNWASEEELGIAWLTGLQVYDAELAGVARQLLLPLRRPKAWETAAAALKREPVVWDAYALRHFHGRLLPGCSHFGCTNTSGISEASLGTLLCSGCKRTRYCSVACQRAAWVEGGHSSVCGKGGWALSDVNT